MDAELLVQTLLEQDPPAEEVPPQDDPAAAEDFLIQHGYMGAHQDVERSGPHVLIFPQNGRALNSLVGRDIVNDALTQSQEEPLEGSDPRYWVAIFNQNSPNRQTWLIRFDNVNGLRVSDATARWSGDVNAERAQQQLSATFPRFYQTLKQLSMFPMLNMDWDNMPVSLHDAAKLMRSMSGSEQQFAVNFSTFLRSNRKLLRAWAWWPKWLQLLCYRAGITRRRPVFKEGMVVDRKVARVTYSDWSDDDLLDFIDSNYHDFAKALFGGDFKMKYSSDWWPEGRLRNYWMPINAENEAKIRELMVGHEVTDDEGNGVTVTPEMVADLKGDDLITQAEDWEMEEITDAVRRALSDAEDDASEAAYLKYYQEGVLDVMGGARPTFIEIEKGKNWRLQIDISLENLQAACEDIIDEHGEDWDDVKSILSSGVGKWEPNDRFEPDRRADDSYFNDQLDYHLSEI